MELNNVCLFVSNLFVIYHSEYITVVLDLSLGVLADTQH